MAGTEADFDNELSTLIWKQRYRFVPDGPGSEERSIRDTWKRVANAVASIESDHDTWARRFFELLDGFRFLPAGRILASAGTGSNATLCNCFVMGLIDDSIEGIFQRLRESAKTMQLGGGIGCDFSTLRPSGMPARSSGRIASGPVSFMHLWDAMCTTIRARGNRRGAMMGTLRFDHPDIYDFIDAKQAPDSLTNFNLSVQISKELMTALDERETINLTFPTGPAGGKVFDCTPASTLWQRLVDAAYASGEPGVLFVDHINEVNNLYYREHITTTNPCGEVPLPPWGACDLGSVNLAAHVVLPFSEHAKLDFDAIGRVARVAVRFLDDVIDLSPYPLAAQAAEARATRRIGLGVTGLADALIMLGLRYDSDAGRNLARTALTRIRDEAYAASVALAQEKGTFTCFDTEAFLASAYIRSLPGHLRDAIARQGIRNSHLLAIAPAGSISILANNISSGVEPVFAPRMERLVRESDESFVRHEAIDFAFALFNRETRQSGSLPGAFVSAHEVSPKDHLLMSAALQPLVDQSIAKTVNVAADIARADFDAIYRMAFDLGLKGCTVFRSHEMSAGILADAAKRAPGMQ